MFQQEVVTKNGVTKTIIASTPEELAEGVKAAEREKAAKAPDIHNPKDGNKIVSPENDPNL